MDQLLAKAKPISNSGSPSGIKYLRMGKSCCATAIAAPERSENVIETTLYTPGSVKKEGKEVLEHTFPCSPWRRP